MVKVSIIIPVYNVEAYLKRSLDSLCKQTLEDIEIICIDDCSTDNSLSILEAYAQKDNRIYIIKLEKNQGAAVARNKGLSVAKGEYLGFVDPDDAVDLNYYEELYKTAKEKNVDLVKCQRITYGLDDQIYISKLNEKIKTNMYNFSDEWQTAIYRTSFIREKHICFPEECRKAQDIVFLARAIYRGATLALINNVSYHYYKREGSLDSVKIPLKHIVSALTAIQLILEEINHSILFNQNIDLYVSSYKHTMKAVFHTLFQNDSLEAKTLCAQALIDGFHNCKDCKRLSNIFPYPWMLSLIQNKETEKLAQHLNQYKKKIEIPLKWYQKILSIKDMPNKHKQITVLGLKFKIKFL